MVAYNITNIERKLQNLWTTNTLFDKKHDDQGHYVPQGLPLVSIPWGQPVYLL
jgi:hypothetical protein